MMQEETIKKILSRYTKLPAAGIGYHTIIDRTTIPSSILIHRMYADLAKEGFVVSGYSEIKDYGMLLNKLYGNDVPGNDITPAMQVKQPISPQASATKDMDAVGIDIEETGSMPAVNDFREDKFYTMYFSSSEISYCILQPAPLVSFAGLFAAKEAIVKANSDYKNTPFNTIIIDHLPNGKPSHADFYLSISHTPSLAIAVAVQKNNPSTPNSKAAGQIPPQAGNTTLLYVISLSAMLLAIIAVIIVILRR